MTCITDALQLVSVLAQLKMDRDRVEVLLHPIETIDRHVQEIQDLEPQVQDLEYKLDSRGQGVRSVEEILLELNSVQRERYKFSTGNKLAYNSNGVSMI
jgi:DNA repair protein RAD50